MKQRVLVCLWTVCWGVSLFGQTTPVYPNFGVVSNPQIDATAVVNYGTIGVSTSGQPFTTQNTLFFTNQANATMNGYSGFFFNFLTNSLPLPANTLFNRGTISAVEGGGIIIIGETVYGIGGRGGLLLASATNIINTDSGFLSAPAQGLIRLEGQNINLTRSGLRTGQAMTGGTDSGSRGYITETNYQNGPGVTDGFASVRTNTIQLSTFGANFTGQQPFVYRNPPGESNQVIQLVFVNTNSLPTNIIMQVGFADPNAIMFSPADPLITTDKGGRIAIVRFGLSLVDTATGLPTTNWATLLDYTAVLKTNLMYLTNFVDGNLRPSVFEVIRGSPSEWLNATAANAPFTNTLIYSPDFVSDTTSNVSFASYSAYVSSGNATTSYGTGQFGNYGSALFPNFADATNIPGRIEILGGAVDLTSTRFRTEGLVTIKTTHLLGNQGVKFDAPIIRFDLASTNGLLVISNLVPNSVERLAGTLQASSWYYTAQLTNAVTSNTTDLVYHVLTVRPTFTTMQPVETYSLISRATNVAFADTFNITGPLLIDADNMQLQLSGAINLIGYNDSIGHTNFPHLKTITNLGSINVANIAIFGDNQSFRLKSFVNQGTISGNAVGTKTETFEDSNGGLLQASAGTITVDAYVGKMDGGILQAAADIALNLGDLKVRNTSLASGSTLNLTITNRLTDGGAGASNVWQCAAGFRLLSKPAEGDLLGTQIYSSAPQFVEIQEVWAAEDRGTNALGYSNNIALGVLTLDGGPYSAFRFSGTGTNNAIYVDSLQFANYATNVLDSLVIDPNFVVYFADSNLPAEQLDGRFDGRLRWVRDFAGPNSSTNVLLPSGVSVPVNKALRNSVTIDSDADGTPNGLDPSPFDGVAFTAIAITNQVVSPVTLLSWSAAAYTVYEVDYATNLVKPKWQVLLNYTNSAATNRIATIQDALPNAGNQRYYRVTYYP